jgi:lysophospholipase L1-like esterase
MRNSRSVERLYLIQPVFFGVLSLVGCGGGGNSDGQSVLPTITSVSVSCSPASIVTSQTSACTAAVTGTGNYSTSVAWSVSPANIGAASSTGVFTPTATGTATILATSTQDSTKSGSATITVTLPQNSLVISFPNPNIYESPDIWLLSGSSIISPTGGAYLKFQVTGTQNITANVDTTLNSVLTADDMPSIKVVINSDTPYFVQLPANNTAGTPITIASGLDSATTYSVSLYMIGGNGSVGDGWAGTSFQTKIDSLEFDPGASLSNQTLAGKSCMFFGDSILETYYGGATTGKYYTYVDYTEAWPSYVAPMLGCEYSQIGIGGLGWVTPGQGGYPNFLFTWDHYDLADLKTFPTIPDYVVIDLGTNDHGISPVTVANNIAYILAQMRIQFGAGTKIILVTPYNPTFDDPEGNPRVGIMDGFASYEGSTPDENAYLIDLGTSVQQYTLAPYSLDDTHPDQAAHAIIGPIIGTDIESAIQ